jgi:hypothetical protein
MRIGSAVTLLAAVTIAAPACSRGDFFRQYEYEEELYLSLDGSASVYVNTSVAALNALRGASFPINPSAQIDRDAVSTFFSSPVTRVTRTPSLSRRGGRRFVHVRLEVDSIERLKQASAFSWSTYRLTKDGNLVVFHQAVAGAAGQEGEGVGWSGQEMIAFRAHLPSTVVYHNAGASNLKRGNILVWEQLLADRLRGAPLELEARMESQSILSRTLLLFGAAFVAVALTFGVVLWGVLRRGRSSAHQ